MKEEWWNLDQAVGWVMTRDENVVSKLKDGGLAAFIIYPKNPPFCFSKTDGYSGSSIDLINALKKGQVIATGFENGLGNHAIEIKPESWERLEIRNLTKPSIAVNENGTYWSQVLLKSSNIKRFFPKTAFSPLEAVDAQELDNIINMLIEECRKNKTKLNRESLYSKVNARLSKERVTFEWAKEKIKTLPADVKNLKQRPSKNSDK